MDNEVQTQSGGLDGMTNKQLQALCAEAGLPTYGAKDVLIARLQEDAAKGLSEPSEVVSELVSEAKPVAVAESSVQASPSVAPAIIQSKVDFATLPPVNMAKHVEEVLDAARNRFTGVAIRYDSNEEVFILEGGRQGRLTTTARQPLRPIMLVIEGYWNIARGRAKMDFGEIYNG